MSLRASAGSPRACSGAMYAGVPMRDPTCVAKGRSWESDPGPRSDVAGLGVSTSAKDAVEGRRGRVQSARMPAVDQRTSTSPKAPTMMLAGLMSR